MAPKGFYLWLASWLSLDLYQRLGDKNRKFILHAVEFYKQKGTASGIANLVSFLTGQPCYVKEYMNNVFRSYGMEHRGEEETDDEMREHMRKCRSNTKKVEDIECTKFYRKTSKTVDTRNPDLLANMGEYCDEVHYVVDTSEKGRYHPRVIGLFVFLPQGEGHSVDEDGLLKVVKSFLPVFVRAKINLVELPRDEKYYLSTIIEGRKDHIHGFPEERIKALQGVYIDHVDWDWLYTCSAGHPEGTTNNVDYRTPHSEMDVEIRIDN